MGCLPGQCYGYCKNKPSVVSLLSSILDAKVHVFDLGQKKAKVDAFPFCGYVVSGYLINRRGSLPKPWRSPVFVPTSTWSKVLAEMASYLNATPPFSYHPRQQVVVLCWGWQAQDRYVRWLWKARAWGPRSTLAKSSGLPAPRKKSMWLRPCRTKFKLPGCQEIYISKKQGFTKFTSDEFEDVVAEKQFILGGCQIIVPRTTDGPYTPHGLRCATCLVTLTNKSCFLSKNQQQ